MMVSVTNFLSEQQACSQWIEHLISYNYGYIKEDLNSDATELRLATMIMRKVTLTRI
jgi:hypothetical protein